MTFPRSADDEIEALKKRGVSQSTALMCAMCGESTKVSNRYKTPWRVINLENGLCRINFICAVNGCEYDLATCVIR